MDPHIHVLIVEDNPGDVKIAKLLLDASGIPHEVTAVEDGQMALAFLNRDAPFLKAPTPALVLLDLGLPKVHGVAVLQQIASQRAASREIVCVIVMSGFADPSTWETARSFGADELVRKSEIARDIESGGLFLSLVWERCRRQRLEKADSVRCEEEKRRVHRANDR